MPTTTNISGPGTNDVTETTYDARSTRYRIVHGRDFVALPDFGVAARMDPHPTEFSYIASKLRLSEPDAKAVWNALNPARPQYDLGE